MSRTPFQPRVRVEPGGWADYARLAPLHYRSGAPATSVLILRAVLDAADSPTGRDQRAGVLVVSMPTLNASWRTRAWPSLFAPGEPRPRTARAVNTHVRTISRVITDPRLRGLGVGSLLVRTYLARPLTRCTEAVAAMARVSPVFAAAGMRRVEVPRAPADAELARELRRRRRRPLDLFACRAELAPLEDALRRWARSSAGARALADAPLTTLARRAASRLAAPPLVFVSP